MLFSLYLILTLFVFFLSFDETIFMTLLFVAIIGIGVKDFIGYNWLTKIINSLYFEFDFVNLIDLFNFKTE